LFPLATPPPWLPPVTPEPYPECIGQVGRQQETVVETVAYHSLVQGLLVPAMHGNPQQKRNKQKEKQGAEIVLPEKEMPYVLTTEPIHLFRFFEKQGRECFARFFP